MKLAHSAIAIDKAHFNALVEVLQKSMATSGVAFSAQNRMLALLAPMHRDIVNVK
jgi:hemoglobin